MSEEAPKIEARENGPLVAKHVKRFILPDGSEAEEKELRFLCRCGQSKNKPYCDGSHKDAGFDGSPGDIAHRDRIYDYEGDEVTVHFNKLLCSHAAECGKRARHIFNAKERPWVKPNDGDIEEIKEVVAACPSGALRYSLNSDPMQLTNDTVEIKVERNGPYQVRNVSVEANYWAKGQSEKKYVLCRCGLSKNKPFCDGTHFDEHWRDTD